MLSPNAAAAARSHRVLPRFSSCRRSYATPTSAAAPTLAQKSDPTLIPPYEKLTAQLHQVRQILNRPLSLAEKILYSHLHNVEETFAGAADQHIRGNKVRVACLLSPGSSVLLFF